MAMWEIEDIDDDGNEGLFVVDAPSKRKALMFYRRAESRKLKIVSCERRKWILLAMASGEQWGTGYFKKESVSRRSHEQIKAKNHQKRQPVHS